MTAYRRLCVSACVVSACVGWLIVMLGISGCESMLGITDRRIGYWKKRAVTCEHKIASAEKAKKQAQTDYANLLNDFTEQKEASEKQFENLVNEWTQMRNENRDLERKIIAVRGQVCDEPEPTLEINP